MSELEPNELERLNALKEWNFAVESRMMLDVTVLRGGQARVQQHRAERRGDLQGQRGAGGAAGRVHRGGGG